MTVFPSGSGSSFPYDKFSDLTLYQFGHKYCTPNYSYGPFAWNHYIFHYMYSGTGVLVSTDSEGEVRRYSVGPGQGFMFWPGQTNTYIADKSEPWEYGWVEFDGILAKELVMQAGLDYNNPVYESFKPEERSRMANAIKHIIDSPDQSPYTLIGYLYIFLDSLVQSSSKRALKPIGSLSDYYVRKAIAYVGQHYAKDITVQDIADYCNIDRSYLSRIFKASLSKTPTQFIIDFSTTTKQKAGQNEYIKLN